MVDLDARDEAPEPDAVCDGGRANRLAEVLGAERIFLNPDCGFGTFADRRVADASVAFRKARFAGQRGEEAARRSRALISCMPAAELLRAVGV